MSIVAAGQTTITDLFDGLNARLSNDSFVATAAEDGSSPVLTGASTTISILVGGVDDSANWTVAATPSSGVTGSLSSGTYTVTGLANDTGSVDLVASRAGYPSLTCRFTLSKSRKGTRGSVQTARAISGTAWSDSEAATAISNAVSDTPAPADVVTLYNTANGFSETRVRSSGGTWTSLTAFFGGDVIVDRTLTASKIQANGLTVNELSVRSLHNLLENPDFENGQFQWTNATRIVNDPLNALRGNYVFTYVSATSANTIAGRSNNIVCREGEAFLVGGSLKTSVGATGNFQIMVRWYDSGGGALLSQSIFWNGENTAYSRKEVMFTAPAGVAYFQVLLYTTGVGTVYWDDLSVVKGTDANMLVAGALTVQGMGAFGGALQSTGAAPYVAGVQGWKIDNDGNAEFNSLLVRTDNIEDGAVSSVERYIDSQSRNITSTTGYSIALMRVQRVHDKQVDLEISCLFEGAGNCILVLEVWDFFYSELLQSEVTQSAGGRPSTFSFSVSDSRPSLGVGTLLMYAIKARKMDSYFSGGWDSNIRVNGLSITSKQLKK